MRSSLLLDLFLFAPGLLSLISSELISIQHTQDCLFFGVYIDCSTNSDAKQFIWLLKHSWAISPGRTRGRITSNCWFTLERPSRLSNSCILRLFFVYFHWKPSAVLPVCQNCYYELISPTVSQCDDLVENFTSVENRRSAAGPAKTKHWWGNEKLLGRMWIL